MSAATKPEDATPSLAPYQRLVAPLETIPKALRELPVWCVWRLLEKPDGKKPGKKPVSPITGSEHGWNLSGFCTTAAKAITYANNHSDIQGIGLVIGNGIGIGGGDLDGCIVNGQPSPVAQSILAEVNTYTEISPGLNGYRFLFFGSFGGHTGNNRVQGVEFYEDNRFLTFTGLHLPWTPVGVERRDLTALGSKWFNDKPDDDGQQSEVPKEHVHIDLDDLKISADVREMILNGAPQGERSEAMFSVALALIRTGYDDATVCHILTDPAYKISEKAFAERKRQSGAMRWVMKYVVAPARRTVVAEQADILGLYGKSEGPLPGAGAAPGDKWPWEEPADILDRNVDVTPYKDGMLPAVYEAMVNANWRYHTHATREPYAGLFFPAVACHLRPSVRVEEKPGGEKLLSLNEQAGIVDGSTHGKTSTMTHALGFDGDDSVLKRWSKREQANAFMKYKVLEDSIRAKHTGDDKAINDAIKELKAKMPPPDIINVKITDKAMVEVNAANDIADVPTNIIVDEWEHVYGGAAYRRDGGNAISDLHRKMADNEAYSDNSSGGGKIESDRMAGNIVFNCTPADMSEWSGYSKAMGNGDMARKSLYAAGKTWGGERDRVIDRRAITAWRDVQEKLHDLKELTLRHEEDLEFDTLTDAEVKKWSRMADDGDKLALWLAKSKIRCSRWASELYLVDQLAVGVTPVGEVTIPKSYRRRAWRIITQFAWPHQVHVHGRLIADESFNTALQILLRRVYATGKTIVKADDLIGGKSSQALRRAGEEFIKSLLFNYKWLRPKVTRVSYNPQRPWEAHQFEVNPGLFEVYRKYDAMLKESHEVAKGQIKDIFGTD